MKYKSTKTHLVLKMTRKEFSHIKSVIDLGLADLKDSLTSRYNSDRKVAKKLMNLDTTPDEDPKFKEV